MKTSSFLFRLVGVASCLMIAAPASADLTEGKRLAAIYDTILHARFDQASEELSRTCPPAPSEACRVIGVVVLWWQIVIDPDNRALDERLQREAQSSIAAAQAWTRREPRRAEAWFYLAGSYAPLTQWQALRGQHLAAARNGVRIRAALERTLQIDPELHDAYFGIGMYHYWADVAPVAAKLLRMLLLLPGGDRAKGLQEMLQARAQGVLLGGEADFQLHWLYLWFEKQPTRALQLVQGLDVRYPSNPVFLRRIAEIEHDYRNDHRASAAAWEALLARAQEGRVERPREAEMLARLGLAGELLDLSQPEQAIATLKVVVETRSLAPYAAQSVAQYRLGVAYDRLGKRDLAIAAYNAAIAAAPGDDPANVRARSREALRRRRAPDRANNFF